MIVEPELSDEQIKQINEIIIDYVNKRKKTVLNYKAKVYVFLSGSHIHIVDDELSKPKNVSGLINNE